MPDNGGQTFYRYFPVAERDRDWGLFITTVGETHIGPGIIYPPPGHPKGYAFQSSAGRLLHEYQIVYISAGHGWFTSPATGKVRIEAGSVVFLFPGVRHSYAPDLSSGWNEHWIGFNGDIVRRLIRRRFFSHKRPILQAGEEDKLLSAFNDIMDSTRHNHPTLQQILAGDTLRILALLFSAQQSKLTGDDFDLKVIHKAVTRMREADEKPINVPELAGELNVSYRWFRRAFAHHTGLSPHQYYLEMRLARARNLLSQTSLSVKEIAVRVGFEDAQYFCRLFHKKIGVPAGVWRDRSQKVHSLKKI